MIVLGVICGLLTALFQSLSYLCSAGFMARYGSSFRLLIFSQLAMGALSLAALPFFLPLSHLAGREWSVVIVLAVWFVVLCIGQSGFFSTQKFIEASRLSSLLGLKILLLMAIDLVFNRNQPGILQLVGAVLCMGAAFVMNWSGSGSKGKITGISLCLLLVTLVFYSLADIVETKLVNMQQSGSIYTDGIVTTLLCYAFMGICSLPFLFKIKWNCQEQLHAAPFGIIWLISQITLMICFGTLGPVFGNVLQSSRGIISVLLGLAVCSLGWGKKLDSPATGMVWVRRICGALMMSGGIICYTVGTV